MDIEDDELAKAVDNFLIDWKEFVPQMKAAIDHLRLFNKTFQVIPIYRSVRDLEIALENVKNEKYASWGGKGSGTGS